MMTIRALLLNVLLLSSRLFTYIHPCSSFSISNIHHFSKRRTAIGTCTPRISQLQFSGSTNNNESSDNDIHDDDDEKAHIRFLGKGERAVVRPGVVLVAPNHEYSHFL